MSKFAILRTKKLKSVGAINLSLKHSFRNQDTPNADPNKMQDNQHLIASSREEALQKLNSRLETQAKIRKNAVYAIEYLITASPEAMQGMTKSEQDAYFADSLEWLRERHGAENIVCAGVHRDETTPHMFAYVVPIDLKGKLNAREFLGGADKLKEMQDKFAERVGKHGLERGIRGSKAKHQRVQRFYANISSNELEQSKLLHKPNPYEIDQEDLEPKIKGTKTVEKGTIFKKKEEVPVYESFGDISRRLNANKINKITDKYFALKDEANRFRTENYALRNAVQTVGLKPEQIKIMKQFADEQRKLNEAEKIREQAEQYRRQQEYKAQKELEKQKRKGFRI